MNETISLSEKVKNIIRDDEELTIVHAVSWDESTDSFSVTRGDSGMEIGDVQAGKKIAEVEIDNKENTIDIHDFVRYNNPDTFGSKGENVELELFKFENVGVDEVTNKVSELVSEYYVGVELNITEDEETVKVESDYADLVFDKLTRWNEQGKRGGVDPDETDLIYRDSDKGLYYAPDHSDLDKVPERVIEALSDAGYTVYADGIDSGWLNWGGRPDFDESETYVDLSDAVPVYIKDTDN